MAAQNTMIRTNVYLTVSDRKAQRELVRLLGVKPSEVLRLGLRTLYWLYTPAIKEHLLQRFLTERGRDHGKASRTR